MNKKFSTLIVTLLVLFFLVGILTYQEVRSNVRRATPTPMLGVVTPGSAPLAGEPLEGLNPTPSLKTDLAPTILEEEKIPVIVRHKDGSLELFLFPPETSHSQIKDYFLPTDSVVAIGPSPSLMGQRPPKLPDISTHPVSGRPLPSTPSLQVRATITPPATPTQSE